MQGRGKGKGQWLGKSRAGTGKSGGSICLGPYHGRDQICIILPDCKSAFSASKATEGPWLNIVVLHSF